MSERQISVAIPTYNRVDLTLDSFKKVYDDERVSEIVIVDDASDWGVFNELAEICAGLPKVSLYRNLSNQDCYRNKYTAIGFCKNKFAILLDSDNEIDADYIDKLYAFPNWGQDTIYTPSFAEPSFDFRAYEGLLVTKENVAEYIDKPMFEVMLNAANYFVCKDEYVKVFDDKTDPVTSDSIYMAYNWLNAGNKIYVVPGLTYQHRVHDGSHYRNNVSRTPVGFHENILNNIRDLK